MQLETPQWPVRRAWDEDGGREEDSNRKRKEGRLGEGEQRPPCCLSPCWLLMSVAHLVSPLRAYHQAPTPELLSIERALESVSTNSHVKSIGARLRLNPSPPGNQEVGGPDREGSSSSTLAVRRWMNGSLSGAWERMGRGSCVPTIGIRQREHGRQALQLNTAKAGLYLV
eukprot:superscaffoldBa00000105_g1528